MTWIKEPADGAGREAMNVESVNKVAEAGSGRYGLSLRTPEGAEEMGWEYD